MSDAVQEKKPKSVFLPGMKRAETSGRKFGQLGRVARLRLYSEKLAEKHGHPFRDPGEMMLHVLFEGRDPLENLINRKLGEESPFRAARKNEIGPDGEVIRARGFVPLEMRINCARILLPFMFNRLSTVHVTSDTDHAGAQQESELAQRVAADPKVRAAFEAIQETIAQQESEGE